MLLFPKSFQNMKHSSTSSNSSSPSSFSSSTISLDSTMCNSKSSTSGGCINAILRRILCSGGLQTHPSDQIREFECSNSMVSGKDQNLKAKQTDEVTTTSTPGVVARLMGLETMVIPSKPTQSGSLSRSKSMNSVDYLGECNRKEGPHKRVRSTLSFREVPTNFSLIENENFLVISFESEGESKGFTSNGRKKQVGSVELKQRVGKERSHLKENKKREKVNGENGKLNKRVSDISCGNARNGGKLVEITNTWSHCKAFSEKKCFDSEAVKLSQHMKNRKEVLVGEKMKRRQKKKKTNCCKENKIETECKSEDSSPVSVLDFDREACETAGLSSRRKLKPELENEQHILLRSDGNLMIEEKKVKAIENNKFEGAKIEKHKQQYIDVWAEVCKLVEDELNGSDRKHAGMNKQGEIGIGSISADFESEIFDHLLNEVIDQLVEDPPITLQLQNS